jgi:hypothetical protein
MLEILKEFLALEMIVLLEERKKKKKRKKKKGLWDNIRARRKAGKRRLRPGEEGYPKTLNIESHEKSLRDLIVEVLAGLDD